MRQIRVGSVLREWLRVQQEPRQDLRRLCAFLPGHHGVIHTSPTLSDLGGWSQKQVFLGTILYYYEKAISIPNFTAIFVPKQVPK